MEHVNGIYIPVGLLLAGTAIVKSEWLPYSVGLATVLSSWKFYVNRMYLPFLSTSGNEIRTTQRMVVKLMICSNG